VEYVTVSTQYLNIAKVIKGSNWADIIWYRFTRKIKTGSYVHSLLNWTLTKGLNNVHGTNTAELQVLVINKCLDINTLGTIRTNLSFYGSAVVDQRDKFFLLRHVRFESAIHCSVASQFGGSSWVTSLSYLWISGTWPRFYHISG
jgi:hypothetical protein